MGFSRQEYWSGVPLPSPEGCLWWSINHHVNMHSPPHSLLLRWSPCIGSSLSSLVRVKSSVSTHRLYIVVISITVEQFVPLCVRACSVTFHSLQPHGWSPQGSSVRGIFQAIILQWVAISFSGPSFPSRDQTCVSCESPTLAGRFFTTAPPGKPLACVIYLWKLRAFKASKATYVVPMWSLYTYLLLDLHPSGCRFPVYTNQATLICWY